MNAWPLKLAQNLGKYDDLIFCPLDMPIPPNIDPMALVEWMKTPGTINMPKMAFEKVTKQEYPWLSRIASEGCEEVKEAFPELYEYLKSFPFESIEHMVFLAQRGHQPIFTHCDSDWLCGMRLYLTSKNREGLHFYKGKERYDEFLTYRVTEKREVIQADWEKTHHMDKPVYATFPENSHAFMLNSGRAAHAVDANTCELGERIAVLIRGKYDKQKLEDLIARSLAKHGNHAIWY